MTLTRFLVDARLEGFCFQRQQQRFCSLFINVIINSLRSALFSCHADHKKVKMRELINFLFLSAVITDTGWTYVRVHVGWEGRGGIGVAPGPATSVGSQWAEDL